MAITIDTPEQRWARYESAKSKKEMWRGLLDEAYKYALPTRDSFNNLTPGVSRTNEIFDSTAPQAVTAFSSNLQYLLMPPFQRWMEFMPGNEVPQAVQQQVKEELQQLTQILFRYLDQSNYALVVNEALQDLSVCTGVMVLNEGPIDNPLIFSSVPLSDVVFEEGPNGTLENFWRDWNIPVRMIQRLWPDAQLTNALQTQLKTTPDEKVMLVECTLYYPDNPPNMQYYSYVCDRGTRTDIVTRWTSYSGWMGFRFGASPGEVLGRGPVLDALSDIRVVNKIAEFELKAAKLKAYPVMMGQNGAVFNPYTVVLEPGVIVPVDSTANPPLKALEMGGDPQFVQLLIQNYQNSIKAALFADPLGPPDQGAKASATEISIRQQNWLRKNAASLGRLTVELLDPLIDKVLRILNNKGLIPAITVDNKRISIKYQSPLIDIQDQEDVQHLQQYLQLLQGMFGPYSILGIKAPKVVEFLAEKLKVDPNLVPDESEMLSAFGGMLSRFEQVQQQPAQAGGQQPTAPQLPQLPQGTPSQ